jgi:hypothetical protein
MATSILECISVGWPGAVNLMAAQRDCIPLSIGKILLSENRP